MKIALDYARGAAAVPLAALGNVLAEGSRTELAVLLYAAAHPAAPLADMAAATGESRADIRAALDALAARGAVTYEPEPGDDLPDAVADAPKKPKKHLQSATLPSYSTEDTARILEGSETLAGLVDACQQIIGKIFSTAEVASLVSMVDYLSLDSDYILLLTTRCAEAGKPSIRYIERTAINLWDSGVTSYRDLEEYYARLDAGRSVEGRVRSMFGLGDRTLTKKEKEYIAAWAGDWGFDASMIEKAWEATVSGTGGKASMSYANKVLMGWFENGIKTPEDVDRAEEARHTATGASGKPSGKTKDAPESSTFDTDDFFTAALRRSYGDTPAEKTTDADTADTDTKSGKGES